MRIAMLRVTRNFGLRLLILLPAMFLFAAAARAQTAPTTVFQLDGTAVQNGSYPGCMYKGVSGSVACDYWNQINGDGTPGTYNGKGHSLTNTFINGENHTYAFMGGGSKDPQPISNWACSASNTPNKDTLTNGYAAAYVAPNDDQVNVFGADRLDTSGDANIGIWFFQEDVECNQSTGQFSNGHKNGDILIVSAFTGGGTVPVISVYEWDTSCTSKVPHPNVNDCAAINLRLKYSAGSLCSSDSPYASGSTLSGNPACSVTNSNSIQVSWPYPTSSSSPPSTIPAQAFFTGGVDITTLIPGSGCFSSFLEDTRTSQSPTATLKDFIGGKFNVCSMTNSKNCNGFAVVGGTDFEYSWIGTVRNTGAQTVTGVSVTDNLTGVSSTNPALHPRDGQVCNTDSDCTDDPGYTCLGAIGTAKDGECVGSSTTSLGPGASAIYAVTDTTSATSVTNTSTASSDTISSVNSTGGSPTCNGSASSTLSIAKSCVVPSATSNALGTLSCSGSGCVVVVPWSAQVCNTGNSEVTGIQVVDTPQPGTNESTITPNNFTLEVGDCTGGAVASDTSLTCSVDGDCPTGYTCSGGYCHTPANPTASYTPTGYDNSSNGYSSGRFLFDDTVSIDDATKTLGGGNPTPVTCPTGITGPCYAYNAASCPLCANGTCPDDTP